MNFKINNNFKFKNIKSYGKPNLSKINYDIDENYEPISSSQNSSSKLQSASDFSIFDYSLPEILQRTFEKITNQNTLTITDHEQYLNGLRDSTTWERLKFASVPLSSILNNKVIDKNVLTLLGSVDLKKINSNFDIKIGYDDTAYYSGVYNIIVLNQNDLNNYHTILHEYGHAYYHNLIGNNNPYLQINSSAEMQNVIQNAQKNILNNQEKLDYMMKKAETIYYDTYEEAKNWYKTIEAEENAKIVDKVNFLYTLNGESLLTSSLLDAGVDSNEINNILSNKEKLISTLQEENQINKVYEYHDNLMRCSDDGLYALGTFSMINSIMQKEDIHIGNTDYHFKYNHDDSYWLDENNTISLTSYEKSYDELMADYFAFNSLGQQELMTDLRELVGDEMIGSLSNTYAEMVQISQTKL